MSESLVALNAKGPRARYGFRTATGKAKSGTIRTREDVKAADLQAIWLATVEVAGTFADVGSYVGWLKHVAQAYEALELTPNEFHAWLADNVALTLGATK